MTLSDGLEEHCEKYEPSIKLLGRHRRLESNILVVHVVHAQGEELTLKHLLELMAGWMVELNVEGG